MAAFHPSDSPSFGPVAAYYDHLMSGVPYRFWMAYIERLWERHGQSPKTVLDLACGTGTLSRLLTEKGYRVTGVDLSEEMLVKARRKTEETSLQIPFIQQDAADLDLGDQRFDAVISVFDSLNYLLEPERLAQAFQRIYAHLNDGGSLLFDVNTEYALAEGMFNQSCTRRDEPLHYRWRSRYNAQTRLCTVHMKFSYKNEAGETVSFTEVHRQRGYAKEELTRWLQEAGFGTVAVYDAYTTDPPYKRSDRLFYVAVK